MLERLNDFLRKRTSGGIALAFSGGVDSSLLLAVLTNLRAENSFPFLVLTAHSLFQSDEELALSRLVAQNLGVSLHVLEVDPLSIFQVRNNAKDRCYWCKRTIFEKIQLLAKQNNIQTLIDGTNADDLLVYRPGRQALRELGVISPLAELGISKNQVRELAGKLGLECRSKPSSPCFATRFEYDVLLTPEKLSQVKAGEKILRDFLGEKADFRLRVHHLTARIEVSPVHFQNLILERENFIPALKALGFRYVALDLEGFRSGSMDEK